MNEYLKNVCNFLNNTKGYIEETEAKELLTMIGCKDTNGLAKMYTKQLSVYVENDEQDKFVDLLYKIKNNSEKVIKNNINLGSTNKPIMKIKIITYLVDKLNNEYLFPIGFDNTRPNNYKLITLKGDYGFNTYDGVIHALQLAVELCIMNNINKEEEEEI